MLYDFLSVYCKLTRIGDAAHQAPMEAMAFREFIQIIDRAQQIVNLEAQQAGFPDLYDLPCVTGAEKVAA